ncbi:hypothetical protein SG9_0070 [Salmonella enterica subsp. enterica serovar Gallinarum str. SG9]|nr:hypothetical protein SG9_0070 [Salmonella enterica subsp. enterica serovar Gallinarum str. SG9]
MLTRGFLANGGILKLMPDKSQLKAGIFYVILHIISKLFCLRGKKIN